MVKIKKWLNKKNNKKTKDSETKINEDIKSELYKCNNANKKRVNKKFKKNLKRKAKMLKKNSSFMFHFNLNSNFIFDPSDHDIYKSMESRLNIIKPKQIEIDFLIKKINEIQLTNAKNKKEEYIWLSQEIFETIVDFKSEPREMSDIEKFILEQLENNEDRSKLSCRNLAELYTEKSGNTIHKSQINNIMRNKLGLHYIKTSIKSNKINRKQNILYSFCFIKILIRALKLGYKLLFQDESCILCSNNNYRCWRYPEEKIFYGHGSKKKKNLLLIVSEKEVIYYKINEQSTNEENFLIFMQEAINTIKTKEIGPYIIIMDNLSVHKTPKLLKFYDDNKINILYNSPYCSYFNAVELSFRTIKNELYKKLFKEIDEVENEVNLILKREHFRNTLLANYKETLCQYENFCEINKYISFKNLTI